MSDISHFHGCSQIITGICSKKIVQFGLHIPTLLSGGVWFHLLELALSIGSKLTSKSSQRVFFIQLSNHNSVVIILT